MKRISLRLISEHTLIEIIYIKIQSKYSYKD